jgi:hypothetical protein
MHATRRPLLCCLLSLMVLSACDFTESGFGTGTASSTSTAPASSGDTVSPNLSGTPPAIAGSKDTVVATLSVPTTVSVAVGSSQTITVTFTSSDGLPIRGLAISGTTLPQGWSGISNYSCTQVGGGNSCVVSLTYSPTAVASGTLSLNYIYISNAEQAQTPGGTVTIPYVATTYNNVVAFASATGQADAALGTGARSVSVTFTTDDGNAATNLAVTSDLAALAPGWSSTASSLSCPIVSTGSGCQLVLSYAPTTATSGTLILTYSYVDNSGTARTGSLNIPYSAVTNGEVVATVSPPGQINAVEKTGRQAVTIDFTTDDGKPATNLAVMPSSATLPDGWSGSASSFSCGSVSTGNGCQLTLSYAPSAPARGTLSFNYGYLDASGTYNVGSVDVQYAATTDDNAVATPTPSGQINAIVGMGSQPLTVTFTTDDGRPATQLEITGDLSALPAGWSSTDGSFACSGFSGGSGCQLTLTYAPTAASTGTLTLPYAYLNNAGESKTGSLNIPYLATTDNNIIATPTPNTLSIPAGSSTPVQVVFTTDDGNPASDLVASGLNPLPAGWSGPGTFACDSVSGGMSCQLNLTFAPAAAGSGTLTLGFSYSNNSAIAKTGTLSIPYTATP